MKLGNNKKNLFLSFSGFCEGGGNCLKYFKWVGTEKRGGETKILKKKGQAGQGMNALKKGGLESPYDTMMFTSTLLQDLFIYFYLLFISHWPLLFCNNIAIHCKMLYANLSQQLHTIKTN